jgi:hypothetical protein
MIRRNIDLIAVLVLLCGFGLYSRAREARIVEVVANKRIALARGGACHIFSALQQLRSIEVKHL